MLGRHARFLTLGVAAAAIAMAATAGCTRRQSNRALDPSNELPFGVMDGPTEGASIGLVSSAGGWAIDDRGIREVRVYIDGRFVNSSPLNTPRPDVAKVYPQYMRGTDVLGWTLAIEFPSAGPHTVLVQAVDTDGATRDLGTVKVQVK